MARDDTPSYEADRCDPSLAAPETEGALCGAMMLANEVIDAVADIVSERDFSEPFFRHLFAIIVREYSAGHTVNPVTLRPFFDDQAYGALADLTGSSGTWAGIASARDKARTIADLAKRRRLVEGLSEAIERGRDSNVSVDDVAGSVEAALSEVHLEATGGTKEVSAADAITAHMKAVEKGLPPGVLSNIGPLDHAMGPIRPGDLQIIAGRPGMGKSILGMSIAKGAALDGHGVLFVSLEMKADQLGMRLASDLCFDGHSGINFANIRDGTMTKEQFRQVLRATDAIQDLPLTIAAVPHLRIGRLNGLIRSHARRFAAKGKALDLVIVDYLQLMDPDRSSDSRVAEITQVSRGLKSAALANDVGIVALAQLSRKVEEREEKRPKLSDLRESGSIEQDADGVLFLYRQEYYLQQTEPPEGHERRERWEAAMKGCRGDIEFICAKRRQGETGIRHATFHGAFQTVRA